MKNVNTNEYISVKNAGMVLLNNYIPMLFERIGLTKEKAFINDTARTDAPHYLQFLVTGFGETEDNLLAINKVLCGIQLSETLLPGIDINEGQQQLIEGLMQAVIGHWPEIGNTSIEGFRGNWLIREGLLREFEERWELTVKKRAYDLLISRSPFSFSIIKYPWMPKPLHVNWPC